MKKHYPIKNKRVRGDVHLKHQEETTNNASFLQYD